MPPVYFGPSMPAFSADGQLLVVEGVVGGQSQLLGRRLDEDAFHLIPGTEQGTRPFLSPDGAWVGFNLGRDKLMKVRVAGGSPVELAEAQFGGGDWGADGTIVYTDGERFLLIKTPAAQRPRRIELVLNWLDELEREVP